jgi:hypothetical protein
VAKASSKCMSGRSEHEGPNSSSKQTGRSCPSSAEEERVDLTRDGEIAYAAIHRRLGWNGRDTAFYGIAFVDGTRFFSTRQPMIYDDQAKRIEPVEILPGSVVKVRYRIEKAVKWMEAIQVVWRAEEPCPFEAIVASDVVGTRNH